MVFSFQGDAWELDLGEKNVSAMRSAFGKYMKAGRAIPLRDLPKRVGNGGEFDPQLVRSWAQAHGKAVADKGRVSEDVVAAWRQAGSPTTW